MIQHVKAWLGSKDLGTRQKYMEAGTLEEYVIVLLFELPQMKQYAMEIMREVGLRIAIIVHQFQQSRYTLRAVRQQTIIELHFIQV